MSHFAEIDEDGIVKRVIVVEQEVLDSGIFGDPKNWIQTSYNTSGGKHRLGGIPMRKNYASVGYRYDKARDAFLPPQPHPSFVLDEECGGWKAPKEYPDDGKEYQWDESKKDWRLEK
jgi:hypothetical protein